MNQGSRGQYLHELGITHWIRRAPPDGAAEPQPGAAAAPADSTEAAGARLVPAVDPAGLGWAELEQAVRNCKACPLHASRTQPVFGVGDRQSRLLIVGEAPGADEDRRGEPFVGRAGQLLNAMLRAIGLARESVFIANILKCRPPNNRDPAVSESAQCTPFLSRQIALLQPQVILALGRISGQWLLQTDEPVGRLRGRVTPLPGTEVPLIVSYHPAYLLRSPAAKAKAWEDLLRVRELLQES